MQFLDPNEAKELVRYHLYAVTSWEGEPEINDDEHSELRWFQLREASLLADLALEEYRPVFVHLLQNKSLETEAATEIDKM